MIEIISAILLVILTITAAVQLYRWHKEPGGFDLRDLLTDKGSNRLSLARTGQLIALGVSTWALVNETVTGRLTDWLFTSYMLAWAGAQIASLAFKASGKLDQKEPK